MHALLQAGVPTVDHLLRLPRARIALVTASTSGAYREATEALDAYLNSPASPWAPISVLRLSVRSYNAVRRAGYHVVEQLLALPEQDLWGVRNIGAKTVTEIQQKLAAWVDAHPERLSFPMPAEEPVPTLTSDQKASDVGPPEAEGDLLTQPIEVLHLSEDLADLVRDAGCKTVHDVASLGEHGFEWTLGRTYSLAAHQIEVALQPFFTRYPDLVRPTALEVLDLSVRARNALLRQGVFSVERLAQMSEEDVWAVRNIGAKSVAEILQKLSAYLSLRPHLVPPPGSHPPAEPVAPPPPPSLVDADVLVGLRERGVPLESITVRRLALSDRNVSLLHASDIRNVGELAQQPESAWFLEREIVRHLTAYVTWLGEQGVARWGTEAADEGISPLYRLLLANASLEDLLHQWMRCLDNRLQQVVRWRYGLDCPELKLDEVGARLGLTRARVSQLEKNAREKLGRALERSALRVVAEFLQAVIRTEGGFVTEAHLGEALDEIMHVGQINPRAAVRLLLTAKGGKVAALRKERVWGLVDLPHELVGVICRHLTQILDAACAPLCEDELLGRFKSLPWYGAHAKRLPDRFVLACAHIDPRILVCSDGALGLEKWERHYQDDVILALRRLGRPAHYSDLTEEINAELPPEQATSSRSVHHCLMTHPNLFVWVGRRGTYGLKEWGLERALSYEETLLGIFQSASEPLDQHQVLARLFALRPYYDEQSVMITLTSNPRFRTFSDGTYGLAEWQEEDFSEAYRVRRLLGELQASSSRKPRRDLPHTQTSAGDFIARIRERSDNET